MVTRIKICGLTRDEDVLAALQLNVHALGFVFYDQSPRFIGPAQAHTLLKLIPPFVSTVGLFVNATKEYVAQTILAAPVDLLQFHGDESPEQCHLIAERVQRRFIRAVRVKSGMKGSDLLQYEAEYKQSPWFSGLLLDSFVDSFGGGGKVFDWSIIPKELAPRVVLSGGLTEHNVGSAVNQLRPWAVDVSSGVEQAKGIKHPAKMAAFIKAVHYAQANLSENANDFQFNPGNTETN